MSGAADSDDDWFEKDIDDFHVKKVETEIEKISFGNQQQATGENTNEVCSGGPMLFPDADYGGNYNKPNTSKNAKGKNQDSSDGTTSSSYQIQPISFKKISFIVELSPLNIFLEIIQENSGFREAINRPSTSSDVILLILKAICKIMTLPITEYKTIILNEIVKAKPYWKQLEKCLNDTITEQPKIAKGKKKALSLNVISDKELWELVIDLTRNCSGFAQIDIKFIEIVKKIIGRSDAKLNLHKYLDDFEQIQTDYNNKINQMEIWPTIDELKTDTELLIQPNVIKGQYPSVKEYLNVHLSLLREDFISPLRDGIGQFKKDFADGMPKSNLNIQFYQNVRILTKQKANTRSHKGEYLMVDLNPDGRDGDDLKNGENLTFSKKFMFGSLLVFTETDKFDQIILAVVSNRDNDLLNQFYIQIEIVKTYNVSSVFGRNFMMFESEVYFEPYHHVYNVLSKFDETTFPLRNYIINIDSTHTYPGYFPSTGRLVYAHRKCTLDMKNPSTWPKAAELKLNQSQLDAMRNSLTNKFSLIHGPPGTGKTFIGQEIVSILLRNTDEQIIIICNTNQALDQFLTGILQFTEDIVRVGQQSKNELLDKFNIKQLTENVVSDKRMKSCFYKAKIEYGQLMGMFEQYQNQLDDEKNKKQTTQIEMKMLEIQDQLRSVSKKQDELKQISDYYVLKSKRVIGMTSTWAARCNTLLQLLKSSIFIVEEAAEMLESHIIAALSLDTKHVILLGDHQQLRPTTSVYKLAKKYKMDISLFERMINNGLNSATLNVQHRMRPEIANLIRPNIYQDLIDHETVLKFPNIKGINKNLFFLNHSNAESKDTVETSKKNVFEAQLLCAFCNYLIIQGHAPEDITILATYNGQLGQFSQERRKYPNLRAVRITVVDNYQGEENKIILLSLVRSNPTNTIGYLAMKNRITVALSRAKEGLFIVGNMDLLAKNSNVWKQIEQYLKEITAIGDEFILQCQTHGHETKVSALKDFEPMKYGGCQDCCGIPLNCGHVCSLFCHTPMFDHFANCDCASRT